MLNCYKIKTNATRCLLTAIMCTQIAALSSCTFDRASDATKVSSQPTSDDAMAKYPYLDQIHPILGVKPGESLGKTKLDKQLFAELRTLQTPTLRQIWKRDFLQVETEAAQQICQALKNMDQAEALDLLGEAAIDEKYLESIKFTSQGDYCQSYCIGGNEIPIRAVFRKGKCIEASIYNRDEELRQSSYPSPRCVLAVHPILKVRAGEHFSSHGSNDPLFYRKLKTFREPMGEYHFYNRFAQAERDAAQSFCDLVNGWDKERVEKLAGVPFYRGPDTAPSIIGQPLDEILVYRFGSGNIPVRISYRFGKFVRAEIFEEFSYDQFLKAREEKFLKTFPCQSIQEIYQETNGQLKSNSIPSSSDARPVGALVTTSLCEDGIILTFTSDRCCAIDKPFIAH